VAADAPTGTRPKPYMYGEELAEVTPWSVDAIEKMVARGVLRRGVHWFQPGGRRVFKWKAIVELIEGGEGDFEKASTAVATRVPARRRVLVNVEEPTGRLRRVLDRGA
jgi:hypothetical protein